MCKINDVIREMGILRKNKNEMLESKKQSGAMKDTFDGLSSRLDMAKERISEFLDVTLETSKTEKHINYHFFKKYKFLV